MDITSSDITSLLIEKLNEGQTLTTLYVTAFTVYISINGALMKFTMDATSDGHTAIKRSLTQIGVATSVVYLLASTFQWIIGQQLSVDIEYLNTQIGSPLDAPQMLVLRFISISAGLFTLCALTGWLFLLRRAKVSVEDET